MARLDLPYLRTVPVRGACGLGRFESIEAIVTVAHIGPDPSVVLLLRGQYCAYATVVEPAQPEVLSALARWEAEQLVPVMLVDDEQVREFTASLHVDGWAKDVMLERLLRALPSNTWSPLEPALRRLADRPHIVWGSLLQAGPGHTALARKGALFYSMGK